MKKSWIDNKYLAIPLLFVLTFVLFLSQSVSYGLVWIVEQILPESIRTWDVWVTGSMYFHFLLPFITILLYLRYTKKNRPILRVLGKEAKGNTGKMALFGVLTGFGMNFLVAMTAMLKGDIQLHFDAFRIVPMVVIYVLVCIQSSTEELADRVFLYQRLRRLYKAPWVAIVVSALFFAGMHLFNTGVTPLSVLNIFLIGLFYALIVYYFDSVWFCCLHHTTWNYTQNILLGLPNSGNVVPFSMFKLDAATSRDSFAYSVSFGVEGTLLTSVMLAAATGLVIYLGSKRSDRGLMIWTDEEPETEDMDKAVQDKAVQNKDIQDKADKAKKAPVSKLQTLFTFTQWRVLAILVLSQLSMLVFGKSYLSAYFVYAAGAAWVIFSARKRQIDVKAILPYHIKPNLKQVGIAFLMYLGSGPLCSIVYRLTTLVFPNTIGNMMEDMHGFIPLFYVAVIGPVFEEFLLRGLMYGGMRRTNRILFAGIASAAFFGIMHGNFSQIFYAFAVGLIFACEREITGSMWVPMIHHLLNNTTDVLNTIAGRTAPQLQKYLRITSLSFDPQNGLGVDLVLLVTGTALVALCLLKLLKPTEEAVAYKKQLDEENAVLLEEATAEGRKLRILTAPYWIGVVLFLLVAVSSLIMPSGV